VRRGARTASGTGIAVGAVRASEYVATTTWSTPLPMSGAMRSKSSWPTIATRAPLSATLWASSSVTFMGDTGTTTASARRIA
jgi:hypothetical protein